MFLKDVRVVLISPDTGKFKARKDHTTSVLNRMGIVNIEHFKSSTEDYPYCLKKAFIDILSANFNDDPVLIVEDDVDTDKITGSEFEFDLPAECDAIYFGVSKNGGSSTKNIHEGPCLVDSYSEDCVRVHNMLATHAIMYRSEKYKRAVVDLLVKSDREYHSDVLMSRIQPNFVILSFKNPIFFQSNEMNPGNDIELQTRFAFEKGQAAASTLVITPHASQITAPKSKFVSIRAVAEALLITERVIAFYETHSRMAKGARLFSALLEDVAGSPPFIVVASKEEFETCFKSGEVGRLGALGLKIMVSLCQINRDSRLEFSVSKKTRLNYARFAKLNDIDAIESTLVNKTLGLFYTNYAR